MRRPLRGRSSGQVDQSSFDAAKAIVVAEKLSERFARNKRQLEGVIAVRPDKYRIASELRDLYTHVKTVEFEAIVAGTLRTYQVSAPERRALEAAFKMSHAKRFAMPLGFEEMKASYDKVYALVQNALAVVQKHAGLEASGGICQKRECSVAGCFRTVNTGDFSAPILRAAEEELAQAAKLVVDAGFPQVCYGDAYVVAKVNRDNVLAFYSIHDDRMYLRAWRRGEQHGTAVATIIHELGHRLDHKFLSAAGRDKNASLFRKLKYELQDVEIQLWRDPLVQSQIGKTFKVKNETFIVESFVPGKVKARFANLAAGETNPVFSFPLIPVLKLLAVDIPALNVFPSAYSMISEGEFFAEMFSYYILDKLPAHSRQAFETILAHVKKTS